MEGRSSASTNIQRDDGIGRGEIADQCGLQVLDEGSPDQKTSVSPGGVETGVPDHKMGVQSKSLHLATEACLVAGPRDRDAVLLAPVIGEPFDAGAGFALRADDMRIRPSADKSRC